MVKLAAKKNTNQVFQVKRYCYSRKISSTALIIFLASLIYWLFTVGKQVNLPQKPITYNNLNSKIISGIAFVIDGDTIKINQERIRLIGIDAPETKQKCLDKNYFEYPCGEVSSQFLKKLVNNKNVSCSYLEKDIYNRFLGSCNLGNLDINKEMIKNGMAVIYNLKDTDAESINLESRAKNKKIGIWQGAFLEPKQYRKQNRNKHLRN